MSRPYLCDGDGCGHTQSEPMAFEVHQQTDDGDEADELHLCSAQCLANYAMSQLDLAD